LQNKLSAKLPSLNRWENITLALGGVFQAAALVEQLAKTGYVSPEPFRTSVKSLFELNPQSTEDVFGNKYEIDLGLKTLSELLRQHRNKDYNDSLRYVLGVIHLQSKLSKRKNMQQIITTRIRQAARQAEHFSETHENVISNIAGLYTDTLSTFRFRIQVKGDPDYLQQTRIANQVRALLFAGVRAAMLWRQVGGNRWQVILNRKRLSAVADDLRRSTAAI